jgi:hypothetical protein
MKTIYGGYHALVIGRVVSAIRKSRGNDPAGRVVSNRIRFGRGDTNEADKGRNQLLDWPWCERTEDTEDSRPRASIWPRQLIDGEARIVRDRGRV